MKFLKKQSIIVILGLLLVFGGVVVGSAQPQQVRAQELQGDIPIRTEIVIPGTKVDKEVGKFFKGKVSDLAEYLDIVYNFLISIVGVLAGVMILVGGFQYMTAGGDAARVTAAKKRIGDALIGLVLALGSFLLLNTINPELVTLKLPAGLTKKVRTELGVLPWCEDLEKDTRNRVSKLVSYLDVESEFRRTLTEKYKPGNPNWCGDIGEVVFSSGDAGYCVYYGTKGWQPIDRDQSVEIFYEEKSGYRRSYACMMGNNTPKEFQNAIEDFKAMVQEGGLSPGDTKFNLIANTAFYSDRVFAEYASCSGLAQGTKLLKRLNLQSASPAVCKRWWDTVRRFVDPLEKPAWAAYCGSNDSRDRCVEVTIDCQAADVNVPDDGFTTANISNFPDQGCGGYDDSPEPVFFNTIKNGYVTVVNVGKTLDNYVDHLGPVCGWNPCKFNLDKGGCTSPGLGAGVPLYRAFISDCRNK